MRGRAGLRVRQVGVPKRPDGLTSFKGSLGQEHDAIAVVGFFHHGKDDEVWAGANEVEIDAGAAVTGVERAEPPSAPASHRVIRLGDLENPLFGREIKVGGDESLALRL